jgi:hypothetical protein
MKDICILDVDSPSYPPTIEEYEQCMCTMCREHLRSIGYFEEDGSFERDMCMKYPILDEN